MSPLKHPGWDGGCHTLAADHVEAYARATAGAEQARLGVPPMLHARLMRNLLFAVMQDRSAGMDFGKLLHASHHATFHRPLRIDDALSCSGSLTALTEHATGRLLRAHLVGEVAGEPVVTCETAFFSRYKVGAPPPPVAPREDLGAPTWHEVLDLPDDASVRYSAASLDDNPLHVDLAAARRAGFGGRVLHGLCTLACTASLLTRHAAGGDPNRLLTIGGRFTRPVLSGSPLEVRGWDLGGGRWALETVGSDGQPVFSAATATLAPPCP